MKTDAQTGQLPKRQLEILQHALGVDKYGRGQQYRNHYCAGGDDVADCAELVALGYMRSFQREWLPYKDNVFKIENVMSAGRSKWLDELRKEKILDSLGKTSEMCAVAMLFLDEPMEVEE